MKFVDVKNDVAFRKIFGNENKKKTENLNVVSDNIDDEGLKEAYFDANKSSWT